MEMMPTPCWDRCISRHPSNLHRKARPSGKPHGTTWLRGWALRGRRVRKPDGKPFFVQEVEYFSILTIKWLPMDMKVLDFRLRGSTMPRRYRRRLLHSARLL